MADKSLTQSEIVSQLANATELTKVQVRGFLEAQSKLAYKNAKNGFTLPGLGKLVLVNRKARMEQMERQGRIYDVTFMVCGAISLLVGGIVIMNILLASYRFKRPVLEVARAALPMAAILATGVLVITYVPWLTLGILKLLGRA